MTQEERRFIIDMMRWSFSRVDSFNNCKREWLLKYIEEPEEENVDSCYAQFGSLCHEILEEFYKDKYDVFSLPLIYEERFNDVVTEYFPKMGNKDFRSEYFDKGYDYFCNIQDYRDRYEVLGVEKKVEFETGGYPFIGFIDLLLRDKETGDIVIVDHKSATMKYKKNGDFTKASAEKFDKYKKQLYLYSIPVIEEFGRVDYLGWNFFKDQKSIKIPWNHKEYENAKKWAIETIHNIENNEDWEPKTDYLYCWFLCGRRLDCPYKNQKKE